MFLFDAFSYKFYSLKGRVNRYFNKKINVISGIETLEKIKKENLSLARFGDGEFNLINGRKIGFQEVDLELSEILKNILDNSEKFEKLIICVPNIFGSLKEFRTKSKKFWYHYLGESRRSIIKLLNKNTIYGDAFITRFYTGFKSEEYHEKIINSYKELWKGKNLIFIEGEKTRMGVGNDFFDNAKSIKRILCPATNAFSKRSEILDAVKKLKIKSDDLIILALGPTATVLAVDLSNMGYTALDLGHLDLQYEYYLRKSSDRVKIEGKFTNEAVGGDSVSDDIIDENYKKQIIKTIS